jgi:hypothetical protein
MDPLYLYGSEESDNFWLHFRMCTSTAGFSSGNADGYWLHFLSASGQVVAGVDINDGKIRGEVMGATTAAAADEIYVPGLSTLDFHVTVGTDITLEIYVNEALTSTVTIANNGKTGVKTVKFVNDDVSSSSSYVSTYTELVALGGESTLGCRLAQLTPNAAGDLSEWGGGYAGLLAFGDGNFLATDTAAKRHSWKHTAYGGSTTTPNVRAVITRSYVRAGDGGPQSYAPFLRIGGVNYDGATIDANLPIPPMNVWDLNPSTGLAWTVGQLTAIEAGLLSIA